MCISVPITQQLATTSPMVDCPLCGKQVKEIHINAHIDSGCQLHLLDDPPPEATQTPAARNVSNFFQKTPSFSKAPDLPPAQPKTNGRYASQITSVAGAKRSFEARDDDEQKDEPATPLPKRQRPNALEKAAPLAERMRPKTLDDVQGQELVGPQGVLRGLIEKGTLPSIVLWGGPGTGKTTIARLIAKTIGTRFVEINSTSSGVAECKKIFADAKNELMLSGRRTILFVDELHRFNRNVQDAFLQPCEEGYICLIGATTENPSFKVNNALLSRCRTFTLAKLTEQDIVSILRRALESERAPESTPSPLLDVSMIEYLAAFSDGDARTALNLLELAIDLSGRPHMTQDELKRSLTHTLVYDRAGDQHYDTISALHKSVRGSDPDASLYYLARMLTSGEDPRYIARRLVVIASEDVGLADSSLLSLAMATYDCCEKIGMPECRINLAHCTVALALAPKSTRAYKGLGNAMKALKEPGVAALPIPMHLRNAPTRLLREIGAGANYKYNPDYLNGEVQQDYLPAELKDRIFLEARDLGEKVDPDLEL